MKLNRLSDLIITNVYAVSSVYTPKNASARKKDRARWAVILKYEGETVYEFNGKRVVSDRNHPILLPKTCSYDWRCTRAGRFYAIEFESELTGAEPMGFSVKNGDKLLKMFRDLEHKRNLKGPFAALESIRDTYAVLLSLLQAEAEPYLPSEKQQKIAAAIDYISQNYHQSITNDELAALTGLSTVYFRKLFTCITGVSPIVYARRLRISKAKEMLKSDCGTMSAVAASLGYANLYDFSRDFKKHVGVSPSKYAQK